MEQNFNFGNMFLKESNWARRCQVGQTSFYGCYSTYSPDLRVSKKGITDDDKVT